MAKNKLVTVAELRVNAAVKAADTLAQAIGVTASETRNASTDTDNLTKKFDEQLESVDDLQDMLGGLLAKYKDAPQLVDKLSGSIGKMASSVSKVESAQSQMEKRKRQGFYKKEGAADKQEIEDRIRTSKILAKNGREFRLREAEAKAVSYIRSVKEKHAHDKQIIAIDKNTNDKIKAGKRDLVTFMRSNAYQKVDTFRFPEDKTLGENRRGRPGPSDTLSDRLARQPSDLLEILGTSDPEPTWSELSEALDKDVDKKTGKRNLKTAISRERLGRGSEAHLNRLGAVRASDRLEEQRIKERTRGQRARMGVTSGEFARSEAGREHTRQASARNIKLEADAQAEANNEVRKTIELLDEVAAARAKDTATIEVNAAQLKQLGEQKKALAEFDAKEVGLSKQKTAALNKTNKVIKEITKSSSGLAKQQEKENLAKDKGVKILSKFEKALDKSDKSSGVRRATGKTNINQLKEMRSSLIKLIGTEKLSNAAKEKAEALTKRLNTQIRQETVAIERLAKAKQKATMVAGGYSKSMGRMNAIISNGSFAVQDLVTVLQGGGGLERAILSTTNNIGMMTSLAMPGWTGAMLGVGAALGSAVVPGLIRMAKESFGTSKAMGRFVDFTVKKLKELREEGLKELAPKELTGGLNEWERNLAGSQKALEVYGKAWEDFRTNISFRDFDFRLFDIARPVNALARNYDAILKTYTTIWRPLIEAVMVSSGQWVEQEEENAAAMNAVANARSVIHKKIKDELHDILVVSRRSELEQKKIDIDERERRAKSLQNRVHQTALETKEVAKQFGFRRTQNEINEADEKHHESVLLKIKRQAGIDRANLAAEEMSKNLDRLNEEAEERREEAEEQKEADEKKIETAEKVAKAIADGQKRVVNDIRAFNKRTSKLLDDQVTQQRKTAEEEKRILEERARQLGIQSDAYIHAMEVAKFKIEQAKKKEEERDDPFRVQTADEEIAALNARRLSLGMGPVKDRRIIRRAEGRETRQTKLAKRDARIRARKSKVRIDDLTEMFQGAEGGLGALGPNDGFTMGVPNQMIGERARIDAYKELLEADRKLIASGKKRKGEPELEKVMSLQEMLAINQEGAAAIAARLVERQNKLAENLRATARANQQIQRSQRPRIQSNHQQ